jgi:hypothetical protein
MKIIFYSGVQLEAKEINFTPNSGACISLFDGGVSIVRELYTIKEIVTPKNEYVLTPLQCALKDCLEKMGYRYDRDHSLAVCAVIFRHPVSNDFWAFGLGGGIMHNPE